MGYDDFELNLQEIRMLGVDWLDLAQSVGQVAGACKRGDEPSDAIKCEEFLDSLRR
jgi:hypothetical protein